MGYFWEGQDKWNLNKQNRIIRTYEEPAPAASLPDYILEHDTSDSQHDCGGREFLHTL